MISFLKNHKILLIVLFLPIMIMFFICTIYIYDFFNLKSDDYGIVKEIYKTEDNQYKISYSSDEDNIYDIVIDEETLIFDVGYKNKKTKSNVDKIDVGDIIDIKYRLVFNDKIRWIFLHNIKN